jgi:hypothetical protein
MYLFLIVQLIVFTAFCLQPKELNYVFNFAKETFPVF